MLEYIGGNTTAMIVLHEIYGVNDFIKERCRQYHKEAYDAFGHMVGFNAYQEINALASNLRQTYKKIVVIGFSVGGALAWRCSESPLYDGIVCCYGSRIRDYLAVTPKCPVLLVFAKEDSFDVTGTAIQLCGKKDTAVEIINGKHGFADCYSENYSQTAAELLNRLRIDFLTKCTA